MVHEWPQRQSNVPTFRRRRRRHFDETAFQQKVLPAVDGGQFRHRFRVTSGFHFQQQRSFRRSFYPILELRRSIFDPRRRGRSALKGERTEDERMLGRDERRKTAQLRRRDFL